MDGKDLHQVTIVGLITRADEQNTNLQYTVDDGTDSINVKMWIDAATDEAAIEKRAQWRCALARRPPQLPPPRPPAPPATVPHRLAAATLAGRVPSCGSSVRCGRSTR